MIRFLRISVKYRVEITSRNESLETARAGEFGTLPVVDRSTPDGMLKSAGSQAFRINAFFIGGLLPEIGLSEVTSWLVPCHA